MKFGVLQFFSWTRRIPLETVYERALDRIAIMDEGGFDAVWLAEHHFNTYSVCPSPALMATHVAARTKHLRIGTAVTLAAFHHPLRLAEDLAMLDILSGGRLNWGAGRGFDLKEFGAFDVTPEESGDKLYECVDVVLKAFTNERISHAGHYWDLHDVELLPKPRQQPHPPFWMAATSPDSIRRAASCGYTILMDPHASNAEIGRKQDLYREALVANGHDPAGREIPVARLIAVAATDAEAEEIARQGAKWTITSYGPGTVNAGVDLKPEDDPAERYVRDVAIHGSPEKMVDRIQELRGTMNLEYLMCAPLSHESFMLFTEKVLPRL